ncbi:MAG: TauD/TfdA family dioxygenase [Arenicellales bacterium]
MPLSSAFNLKPVLEMGESDYQRWREEKLRRYIPDLENCLVPIQNPLKLRPAEKKQLQGIISSNNFVVYQYPSRPDCDSNGYREICCQLGLNRSISNPGADADNVTKIQDHTGSGAGANHRSRYIPYSNLALNWHTDGYYNNQNQMVRAFVLHCMESAPTGGVNKLMDHEIAYILLRDQNPDWAEALSDPKCLTIPENIVKQKVIRDQFIGPVFSTDPATGELYARYTERKHNVVWKDTPTVEKAVSALAEILRTESGWTATITLQRGQGLICNNVLHNRSAFEDNDSHESKRCLHRIRFAERVQLLDE